jgi:hypothetical protein
MIAQAPAQSGALAGAVNLVLRRAHFVARATERIHQVLAGEINRKQSGQARLAHRPRDNAAAGIIVIIDLVGPGHGITEVPVVVEVSQHVGTLRGAKVIGEVVAEGSRRRTVREVRETLVRIRVQEWPRVRNETLRGSSLLIADARRIFVGLNLVLPVGKECQLADRIVVDKLQVDLIAPLVTLEIPGTRVVMRGRFSMAFRGLIPGSTF